MNNLRRATLLFTMLLLSFSAISQDRIVGTGAFATLVGIYNVYYQGKMFDSGGYTLELAHGSNLQTEDMDDPIDLSSVGLSYKHYIEKYLYGTYGKLGLALITASDSDESASGLMPILLIGYESEFGGRFVFGVEAGLGTTAGLGFLGIYLGMKL